KPTDAEGIKVLSVAAVASTDNWDNGGASVVFDFTPPIVASLGTTVSYVPAASNPLAQSLSPVTKATAGTKIRVIAFADEPLDQNAPMTMVAKSGAATIPFTLTGRTTTSATFEAT